MKSDPIKSWEVKASTGNHFDVLDGIRGIAILMVVVFHTFYVNPQSNAIVQFIGGIIGQGWMGVQIFFILSGFLISYPFFRRKQTQIDSWCPDGYAARRIGKIVPPFFLSIIIFSIYYLIRFADPAYLKVGLTWALGLPNFIRTPLPFDGSYWSLVIEVHFYLLLPLLFWFARGLKLRHTVLVLFAVLFFAPLLVRQLTWPAQELDKDSLAFLMQRFPCQLDYFAWGVLFSGVFVSLSSVREQCRALSLFGYVGLALVVLSVGLGAFYLVLSDPNAPPTRWSTEVFHMTASISAFLLLFFVFDPACFGARLLANSWLRFVGIVSYEWFLFHQPVITLFSDIFGNTHGSLFRYFLKTVVPLALTFLFSVFVYRYFSLPIMKRVRKTKPKPASSSPGS